MSSCQQCRWHVDTLVSSVGDTSTHSSAVSTTRRHTRQQWRRHNDTLVSSDSDTSTLVHRELTMNKTEWHTCVKHCELVTCWHHRRLFECDFTRHVNVKQVNLTEHNPVDAATTPSPSSVQGLLSTHWVQSMCCNTHTHTHRHLQRQRERDRDQQAHTHTQRETSTERQQSDLPVLGNHVSCRWEHSTCVVQTILLFLRHGTWSITTSQLIWHPYMSTDGLVHSPADTAHHILTGYDTFRTVLTLTTAVDNISSSLERSSYPYKTSC